MEVVDPGDVRVAQAARTVDPRIAEEAAWRGGPASADGLAGGGGKDRPDGAPGEGRGEALLHVALGGAGASAVEGVYSTSAQKHSLSRPSPPLQISNPA